MSHEELMGLIIALGLGLLTGLQRETVKSSIAGIRTFTLIALMGYLTGLLATWWNSPWIIATGLLSLTLLLLIANYIQGKQNSFDVGQTTEVAVLVIFLLTAYLSQGHQAFVIVVGGLVAGGGALAPGKSALRGAARAWRCSTRRGLTPCVRKS